VTNATGPGRELTIQAEWKQWLENTFENFEGNLDNAALLMTAFTQVKSYVFEKLTTRGLKDFQRPHTIILLDDVAIPVGEVEKGKYVYIAKKYLGEMSQNDMQRETTVTRPEGAIAFQGLIPDLFRLDGVEETHHAAYHQTKTNVEPLLDPISTPMEEYDAREIEYRALKWRVRYAEEQKMPEVTVNLLRKRLEAANTVRANIRKKRNLELQQIQKGPRVEAYHKPSIKKKDKRKQQKQSRRKKRGR